MPLDGSKPHAGTVRLVACPRPFSVERIDVALPAGGTLADMVAAAGIEPGFVPYAHVFIGDIEVPRENWRLVRPKEGHVVTIRVAPAGGGKNPLRTVLTIAVIAAAAWVTGGAAAGLLGADFAAGTLGAALLGAGTSLAGMLAVNAIAPPPKAKLGDLSGTDQRTSPTLTGARNRAMPYGPVPIVLGRHRFAPPYAAKPYTELQGNDQYLNLLFCCGYGPLELSDFRIGETPLDQFEGVDYEVRQGFDDDSPRTLFTSSVDEEPLAITLTQADSWQTRTTGPDADAISVDITFPQGLVRFDDRGRRQHRTVQVEVEYRKVGTTTWKPLQGSVEVDEQVVGPYLRPTVPWKVRNEMVKTRTWRVAVHRVSGLPKEVDATPPADYIPVFRLTLSSDSGVAPVFEDIRPAAQVSAGDFEPTPNGDGTVTIGAGTLDVPNTFAVTENRTSAVRRGRQWPVARGQYEVRLRRVTADATEDQIFDTVSWTALRTIRSADPINLPGMATVALRIKATDQLSGVVDEFNLIAQRIADDWDGSQWISRPTRNPAAAYLFALLGAPNKRPLTEERIDFEGLQDWYEACDANGWTFDAVIDFNTTLAALLDDIAAAGRASRGMKDGKYSVVRDKVQTVPTQHFTPRNSWGFEGERAFPDLPHALKARFIDEDADWSQGERIVYDDGYSEANATRFETVDFFGVTDADLVWKHARFHIAQARLRPETFSFNTDVEHIVCTRGDLIRVSHDAISVGLGWGRIKSLTTDASDNVTAITLDERVGMDAGKLYAVKIRRSDNSELARSVDTVPGVSATLTFSTPVAPADAPEVGDLVQFGEADRETLDAVVTRIEMRSDLEARIVCVPAAPEIHEADTGTIPDYDPVITVPATVPAAPQILDVESGNRALTLQKDGTVQSRILVSLAPGAGSVPTVAFQGRFRLSGSTAPWISAPESPGNVGEISFAPVDDLLSYDLQVRGVGPDRTPSEWVTIFDHMVIGKTAPPPPPDSFTVARMADGTRKFEWALENPPADVRAGGGYRIYWFRGSTTDLAQMTELPPGLIVGTSLETNELSAGDYTFAIVTVDSSGNESDPVFIEATLGDPRLRGVLAQRFEHELGWPGTLTDCFVDTDNVIRALSQGTWADLPATWAELPATWNTILPNRSPIAYETEAIDLGADLSFTPLVTPEGTGTFTIEMMTGTEADGDATGSYEPVGHVQGKRYVKIKVTVADTEPELRALTILLDGETVVEDFEDIDTSASSGGHFERVATGHFRIETKGDITIITSATIRAFQNAGSGWTWEVIKPPGASGVLSGPYAEFRIFKDGTLADAVVDVELKGSK